MNYIREQNTPYTFLETFILKCVFGPVKLPGLSRNGPLARGGHSWCCSKRALRLGTTLGSLSRPRRRRQRERHETKGLMSKTIAVHVRYNSLYISLPSSANQELEMTNFCVVY